MIPIRDHNPTSVIPYWTYSILAACVLVFLWQSAIGPGGAELIAYRYGMVPAVLLERGVLPPGLSTLPPVATAFTAMFLHGSFMHLAGNVLYLWIFGNNIEDALGHLRFVAFYLICGLAAAIAQSIQQPDSTIPMIGASGAIAGVLGAYLVLYPRVPITVVWPPFLMTRLPAMFVLGAWLVFQILNHVYSDPGKPGVAWLAHIGGFITGMALGPWLRKA